MGPQLLSSFSLRKKIVLHASLINIISVYIHINFTVHDSVNMMILLSNILWCWVLNRICSYTNFNLDSSVINGENIYNYILTLIYNMDHVFWLQGIKVGQVDIIPHAWHRQLLASPIHSPVMVLFCTNGFFFLVPFVYISHPKKKKKKIR